MHISEMQTKIDKNALLFEIEEFEVVVRKSAYGEVNTCHRESTC